MDMENLCRASHTLKASARDFGAPRLAEVCEALEHSARDGHSEPAALVRSIAAEYAMAGRELKISGPGPGSSLIDDVGGSATTWLPRPYSSSTIIAPTASKWRLRCVSRLRGRRGRGRSGSARPSAGKALRRGPARHPDAGNGRLRRAAGAQGGRGVARHPRHRRLGARRRHRQRGACDRTRGGGFSAQGLRSRDPSRPPGTSLQKKRFRDQEREFRRLVGKLTEAAETLESQSLRPERLALDDIVSRQDPLGRLGRVFQSMAEEIYERERRLRRNIRMARGSLLVIAVGVSWGIIAPLSRMASGNSFRPARARGLD